MTLELNPPDGGFGDETMKLAEWLSSQAAIALENARLHDIVQWQAITDELTGLVNRRRFLDALRSEITRGQRLGGRLSVVLADLDDFKLVNDRFGHHAGDEVLIAFADLIKAHGRDVDVAARLGGEEFAILLPETGLDGASAVAERLRLSLAELQIPLGVGEKVTVTASFGVAELGESAVRRRAPAGGGQRVVPREGARQEPRRARRPGRGLDAVRCGLQTVVRADAACGPAVCTCRCCGECRIPVACRARRPRGAEGSGLGAAGDPLRAERRPVQLVDRPARGSCTSRAAGGTQGRAGATRRGVGAALVRACERVAVDRVHSDGARGSVFAPQPADGFRRLEPRPAEAEAEASARRQPEAAAGTSTPAGAATCSTAPTRPAGSAAARTATSAASGRRRHQAGVGQGRPAPRPHGAARPLAAPGWRQRQEQTLEARRRTPWKRQPPGERGAARERPPGRRRSRGRKWSRGRRRPAGRRRPRGRRPSGRRPREPRLAGASSPRGGAADRGRARPSGRGGARRNRAARPRAAPGSPSPAKCRRARRSPPA